MALRDWMDIVGNMFAEAARNAGRRAKFYHGSEHRLPEGWPVIRDLIKLIEAASEWPATATPHDLLAIAERLHYRPEDFETGDFNHRIWKFRRYVLSELPTERLHTPWTIHDDLVQQYAERMRHGETPPPIFWDAVDHCPIDGGHRIEAAKLAGLRTLPAYLGLPENIDPDWDEFED